jgi:hypothetical protein
MNQSLQFQMVTAFIMSISLKLYGSENHLKRLRFVSLDVFCQYELYFKENKCTIISEYIIG